jgi:hypothetical protein
MLVVKTVEMMNLIGKVVGLVVTEFGPVVGLE